MSDIVVGSAAMDMCYVKSIHKTIVLGELIVYCGRETEVAL